MSAYDMIIDGQKVSGNESFDVINPATEETIASCPKASVEQLNSAVDAAQKAFKSWSQTDSATRAAKIHQIAALIEENTESLAKLLTEETGKAMQGMGSFFEAGGSVAWTHATAEMDLPVEVIEEDDAHRIELHRKPLGVVGSIVPWNFPLMIAIWHIIPALKAGNTVVIKPSPLAPLSAIKLVELMNEVLPAGVVNIVTGEDHIGEAITQHPDISKVIFTGSTNTGKNIMANCASTLKRLTLELGGNDAAIVLPDVDPNAIAETIFHSAFVNSGQTCAALKRLYVHEEVYDQVCDALVNIANQCKVGNGLEQDVVFGPIQNKQQYERVCQLAEDTKAEGGRFLTGGEPMPGPGYFFPITLVADISDGSRLVDEEPFGPMLPIIKFSDVDEVIARANKNSCGLGGSVWSGDTELATKLAGQLECGTAWVNTHAQIQPNVPFGGVKDSGFGVEFSTQGLEEYTSIQVVHINKG